jgi:hypothetical protein
MSLLPLALPYLFLTACRVESPKDVVEDDTSGDTADTAGGNASPVIGSVVLTPADARTNDVLVAVVEASDADGDAVALHYAWTVDGVVAGGDADTLDGATAFEHGATVTVTVTPNDGTVDGAPVSASTVIGDIAPEGIVVAITPASPLQGDDLVCTATASDADGDTLLYAYSWYVDGVPYSDATAEAGQSVVSGADVVGDSTWTCAVVATDPSGASVEAEASVSVAATCLEGASFTVNSTARSELETINAVVSDADGDGYEDILFVNQLSSSVTLWWGDGSGSPVAETTLSMGRVGYGVDAGDINGDGYIDVVASNQDANTYTIAWGSGPRTFSGTSSFSQSGFPQGVTLVDADRDGDLDLVTMLGSGWGSVAGANCNAILINNGSGSFSGGECLWMDTNIRRAGDLDGDGYAELVSSNTGDVYSSASGTFAYAYTVSLADVVSPSSVFPYDADGDGDVDLVVADSSDYSLTTLSNHGSGEFRGCAQTTPLDHWPNAVGDLDDDGDVDFASVATCGYCSSTFYVGLRD